MKTITLTDEQHARLKAVLDRACEERPNSQPLQELWHACARATTPPAVLDEADKADAAKPLEAIVVP